MGAAVFQVAGFRSISVFNSGAISLILYQDGLEMHLHFNCVRRRRKMRQRACAFDTLQNGIFLCFKERKGASRQSRAERVIGQVCKALWY